MSAATGRVRRNTTALANLYTVAHTQTHTHPHTRAPAHARTQRPLVARVLRVSAGSWGPHAHRHTGRGERERESISMRGRRSEWGAAAYPMAGLKVSEHRAKALDEHLRRRSHIQIVLVVHRLSKDRHKRGASVAVRMGMHVADDRAP
jgi:hypothetical protein